jgi:hypothetical protein
MESIQQKANAIFSTIFPGFKSGIPHRNATRLFLPFTYFRNLPLSGIMVYEVVDFPTKAFVSFNPFESMPPHCVLDGVDWINMKYIEKLGEFDVFAESICEDAKQLLIHVNEGDPVEP